MTVEDVEAWVDALAGRLDPADPNASPSSAKQARLHLVNEARVLREEILAQVFNVVPAAPRVDAARERQLIERAQAAGLLTAAAPRKAAPTRTASPPHETAIRRRWIAEARPGWRAAAMVLVAVGAAGLWWPQSAPPEALRGVVGGTVHLAARDPPALKRQLVGELSAAGVRVTGYERFGHLGIDADLALPISPAARHVLERHRIPVPADGALIVEFDPVPRP